MSAGLLYLALSYFKLFSVPKIRLDLWVTYAGRYVSDHCLQGSVVHMVSRSHVFGFVISREFPDISPSKEFGQQC